MNPRSLPKNLLLLGANGRTGREILTRALSDGHSITAVVRAADRLADLEHDNLEVVVGDVTDERFLEQVMPGHDVVISTLGPRWPSTAAAAIYPKSGAAIVSAMWNAGVKRLLVTSSALLFPSTRWWERVLKWLVSPIVEGASQMESHIQASKLDWTIARTSFLHDAETTSLQVGEDVLPEPGGAVSRAAVAQFLMSEVEQQRFGRQVVGLCGPVA